MAKNATPAKTQLTDKLDPLPEPDVQWVDGKDQWGYDAYDHAYSAEAMKAYAAQCVAQERERCAVVAWTHYMDTCRKFRFAPAMWNSWCAASAIRGGYAELTAPTEVQRKSDEH